MAATPTHDRSDVVAWFDKTYRTKGFQYLRPLEAYPIFLQLLDASPGERLLDVACGPGLLLEAARRRGVVPSGIDISETAIDMARELVPAADLYVGSAEDLPFADGAFDLITCTGALERFFDRGTALAEIHRVTADGGRLCFMVRNAGAVGWKVWRKWLGRQNHAGHQDALDFDAWQALFRSNGFAVQDVFMDQWQRQKLRKLLRLLRSHDFSRPEPIARPLLSMRFVYEFIFILRKQTRAD